MNIESYGLPALQLGPLRIWVHGRQFPEMTDAWDGNWLNVTAHYAGHGGAVVVTGSILDTVSFSVFGTALRKVYATLEGEASLKSVEPNLLVRVSRHGRSGGMVLRVEMTPDHINEGHWFEEAIDQSYLPPAIAACEKVLKEFPVLDPSERGL
jgi:hypothetical protein